MPPSVQSFSALPVGSSGWLSHKRLLADCLGRNFEVGVPASLLGFVLGLVTGSLTYVFRRVHPH